MLITGKGPSTLRHLNEVYSTLFLYYDAALLPFVNVGEIYPAYCAVSYKNLVIYPIDIRSRQHYFNPYFSDSVAIAADLKQYQRDRQDTSHGQDYDKHPGQDESQRREVCLHHRIRRDFCEGHQRGRCRSDTGG